MSPNLKSFILEHTKASDIINTELIQSLWSGYGEMLRVGLQGSKVKSVVLKDIKLTEKGSHPRCLNSDIDHQRKLKSYKIEMHWYKNYTTFCQSRLPKCLGMEASSDHIYILLEDLNEAGYPLRKQKLSWQEFSACLRWLAEFHVSFLGKETLGLWPIGTYWHLDTRPNELEALKDLELKLIAKKIDEKLNSCHYKTFVHGDAKVANFCFSNTGKVAGVDFQYVGGGCGMKDVAYFTGSCLSEVECERLEDKILSSYFQYFHQAYGKYHKEIEQEWRDLYPYAWADFHRFLKGWSPEHWKINTYSERVTRKVIKSLQ